MLLYLGFHSCGLAFLGAEAKTTDVDAAEKANF
jgi:hypothetical protein